MENEAKLTRENNILLVVDDEKSTDRDDNDNTLFENFFGEVIFYTAHTNTPRDFTGKTVYVCGNLSKIAHLQENLEKASKVLLIEGLSQGFDGQNTCASSTFPYIEVGLGRVPLDVHNVGILYKQFFGDNDGDLFKKIESAHPFHSLTESNKPGKAYRTGTYLSNVSKDSNNDDLRYNLLRCSTNMSGATDNFGVTDRHVIGSLNDEANRVFNDAATLNHTLAQIYHNLDGSATQKPKKASIKMHADKTKDMPRSGIMAFCTFYKTDEGRFKNLKPIAGDSFDRGHKNISAFTTLDFRLKKVVAERPDCNLPKRFNVKLYPNSVFMMPLSTNRLYTHEIRPSSLDAHMLPTRMGYVVRCSNTEAIYRDGDTLIQSRTGDWVKLGPPTHEGMLELREMYARENVSDAPMNYGRGTFLFSMNQGDYLPPGYRIQDEFPVREIPSLPNHLFKALKESAGFEAVCRGRRGTVLVKPDNQRGTPIVRTTTKYIHPATCFQQVHLDLIDRISDVSADVSKSLDPSTFNNALIENYGSEYSKMGFHSDQSQDLADGSWIAIFSCYKYPELLNEAGAPYRKLVIQSKQEFGKTGSATLCEIPLRHNSVVFFSLDTNRRFQHKIVLDWGERGNDPRHQDNEWLGITFRTSKTFVKHGNGVVDDGNDAPECTFEDGVTPFKLASEEERVAFFKMRREENQTVDFEYPKMDYTISPSDMMPPRMQET